MVYGRTNDHRNPRYSHVPDMVNNIHKVSELIKMGTLVTLSLKYLADPEILMDLDMTVNGHPLDIHKIGIPLELRTIGIPLMNIVQTHHLPESNIIVFINI